MVPAPVPRSRIHSSTAAIPDAGAHLRLMKMCALVLTLTGLAPGFALQKQAPLSRNRDRAGLGLHTKVSNHSHDLSASGKRFLSLITTAGRQGDWINIRRMFSKYTGTDLAIFHAVMHGAYICGQYREGARVYQKVCDLKLDKDAPIYATAIKLFAKLGQPDSVKDVWAEAMDACELDQPLAAARINAAALEADVPGAAEVLDTMNKTGVDINRAHITSAMRACWEAEGSAHNAAAYLFQLLLDLNLQPNVAVFTCLVGAYDTAPLEMVERAYADMKERGIAVDFAFAETYLGALLFKPKVQKFNQQEMISWLRQVPARRIAAAKSAMKDFERANLKLTSLSQEIRRALRHF